MRVHSARWRSRSRRLAMRPATLSNEPRRPIPGSRGRTAGPATARRRATVMRTTVVARARVHAPGARGRRVGAERGGEEDVCELVDDHLGLRALDVGAGRRPAAPDERGQHGRGAHARAVVVGVDRGRLAEAELVIWIAPQARDARDAAHDRAVAEPAAPRPGRAERVGAQHHEVGLDGAQRLVAEPELLERPRLEVLEHDVGAGDEPLQQRDALRRAQVHAELRLLRLPATKLWESFPP